MADVRIKLNHAGIRTLLQSDEMASAIKHEAAARGAINRVYIAGDRVCVIVKEGGKDADRSKDN